MSLTTALEVLEKKKVAIFIVAYNVESHIASVLDRIPYEIACRLREIYIIDDSSTDKTSEKAQSALWPNPRCPLKVFRTPYNQGYGGNQRLGYFYALAREFDIVILLHGDGQYAPESLTNIIAEYKDESVGAVYGSRFLTRFGALKGGMPLYKFVGNRILTTFQNWITGLKLSEWHSGYRSYRVSALRKVPFHLNSRDFDFDTDIIIQFLAARQRIKEIPIPTFYGDEISHVNGIKYAAQVTLAVLQYRLKKLSFFYNPKYDIEGHLLQPLKLDEDNSLFAKTFREETPKPSIGIKRLA